MNWDLLILLEKEFSKLKNLLAMKIRPDTNDGGGASRGSINRSYEGVGKNPSLCPYFERPLLAAMRGHGLPFQRIGGECAGFA
jgi:hypothetical protein